MLSIIIPFFNEERFLRRTVLDLLAESSSRNISTEIILVDDGSTDGSFAEAKKLEEWYANVSLIRFDKNRGKGEAVRVGVASSCGTRILMIDADGSAVPDDAFRLVATLEGADVAVAIRDDLYRHTLGYFRHIVSAGGNILIRLLLLPGFFDTQCGLKAFRGDIGRRIFSGMRTSGYLFDVELLLETLRWGHTVTTFRVRWVHREKNQIGLIATTRSLWEFFIILFREYFFFARFGRRVMSIQRGTLRQKEPLQSRATGSI